MKDKALFVIIGIAVLAICLMFVGVAWFVIYQQNETVRGGKVVSINNTDHFLNSAVQCLDVERKSRTSLTTQKGEVER